MELAEVFRRAGPAYRQAYGARMPPQHLRAMDDIVRCRTAALGGSVYACDDCGSLDYAYHSCRNRHCPKCQGDLAQDWLERLRARLLPCDHYLLTFTLPGALRALARSQQRTLYDLLLRQAAAAVQALAADPQWIGACVGILAVLHTWSRNLAYHPHVHLLVTAGGLSPDGSAWIKPAHARFLFPGYMLSQLFRGKVRAALSKAGLADDIAAELWTARWNVHIQQIGSGEHAALYLSRYVYRVALTDDRIERLEHGQVTFRYTDARTRTTRRMTLPAADFIARFLQHVLPKGFPKVRSYGLLSSSSRPDLERARQLLEPAAPQQGNDDPRSPASDDPRILISQDREPARLCPVCKTGHLQLVASVLRSRAPP